MSVEYFSNFPFLSTAYTDRRRWWDYLPGHGRCIATQMSDVYDRVQLQGSREFESHGKWRNYLLDFEWATAPFS
jgi:hypothetical protein